MIKQSFKSNYRKMFFMSAALSFIVSMFVLCVITSHNNTVSAQLTGTLVTCNGENHSVNITGIANMKCIDCTCKNGIVECKNRTCPNNNGCYMLRDPQGDECCPKCKGCMKNGVYYESGTVWTEPGNPCTSFTCLASVITETKVRCYTTCDDPIPPALGKCCTTCPGCTVNGSVILKPTQVMQEEDPCVKCHCDNGKLECLKKACPVLNCPDSKKVIRYQDCCPQCLGTRKYFDPPNGACLLGSVVYESETRFTLDQCTRCICRNSTVHCEKQSCPVLKCKRAQQRTLPGQCCAQCAKGDDDGKYIYNESNDDANHDSIEIHEIKVPDKDKNKEKVKVKTSCTSSGKIYKDGESWNTDTCETCTCSKGKVKCKAMMCPAVSCPPNSVLKVPEGECCPVCEENNGVCTVFGGSHIRTFDSKLYAFLGSCKYLLASDCVDGIFNMRMKFNVTGNAATIKRLTLKLGSVKVDLQQSKVTKINDKIVFLPFTLKNKLTINETKDAVVVASKMGIKVNWNYAGFLEVTVPTSYQKQLCGLCGNFNSIANDDLTTREGVLVNSPATFAKSWDVGDAECLDTREYDIKECDTQKDQRLCELIKGSTFEKCLKRINVAPYYETCVTDVDNCPQNDVQCHCESFTSYARDCRRLGISLPSWRESVGC